MTEEFTTGPSRRQFLQGLGLSSAALLLAACGGNSGGGGAQTSGGQVTLDWLWRNFPGEETTFKAMLAEYQKANPTIKVNETYVPIEGYDQKVDLMASSGQTPAIWSSISQRGVRYYASRDQMVELDQYVGQKFDTSAYPKAYVDLQKWKDKLVGMPSEALTLCLVYNKTMMDKKGIKPPTKDWADKSWNWDVFLDMAKELTGGDEYGFLSFQDLRYEIADFGMGYWPEADDATGYPTKLNDTPEFVAAWQFMADLIYKHKVQPNPAQSQQMAGAGGPDLFTSGKFGMRVTFAGAVPTYAAIKDFEWGFAAIPAPVSLPRQGVAYIGSLGVLKPQNHEADAVNLLSYLTQEPQQKKFPIDAQGWLSTRTSLKDYWTQTVSEKNKVPAAELTVLSDALDYSKPAAGAYAVEWQQFWEKAIKPAQDTIMNGTATAAEGVAAMKAPFEAVIAQTKPK